ERFDPLLGVVGLRAALFELGIGGHVFGARLFDAHLAQALDEIETFLAAIGHAAAGPAIRGSFAFESCTSAASSRSSRVTAEARVSVSSGRCARNCSMAGTSWIARSRLGVVPAR